MPNALSDITALPSLVPPTKYYLHLSLLSSCIPLPPIWPTFLLLLSHYNQLRSPPALRHQLRPAAWGPRDGCSPCVCGCVDLLTLALFYGVTPLGSACLVVSPSVGVSLLGVERVGELVCGLFGPFSRSLGAVSGIAWKLSSRPIPF